MKREINRPVIKEKIQTHKTRPEKEPHERTETQNEDRVAGKTARQKAVECVSIIYSSIGIKSYSSNNSVDRMVITQVFDRMYVYTPMHGNEKSRVPREGIR